MISNEFIADFLEQIATLLELKQENKFKIRAYRMAAAKIREIGTTLAKITQIQELENIPGIGKSLAEKIWEIIHTQDCAFYRELVQEMPLGLLDLLRIEGLGPKRVMQLHQTLGIQDVAQLQLALNQGKLADLPGFGKKIIAKIEQGLIHAQERASRFPLYQVLELAKEIVGQLRQIPGVVQVEIAGSVRRWKETAKDLDILATGPAHLSEHVMDIFARLPQVSEVILKGSTKTTVKLRLGIQVDLRFVDPDCFGASMQYFTGSKEHNVALRTLAKAKRLKISEYGLFQINDQGSEIKIAGDQETSVYQCLGLAYIEPELRENTGEISFSQQNVLPKLITCTDIRGDLQMHTTQSDGQNTLIEMIEACQALGYEFMAVTEHSKSVYIAHGLDEQRLHQWIAEIHAAQLRYPNFTVLAGIEVDILKDGSLDLEASVLENAMLW